MISHQIALKPDLFTDSVQMDAFGEICKESRIFIIRFPHNHAIYGLCKILVMLLYSGTNLMLHLISYCYKPPNIDPTHLLLPLPTSPGPYWA